jgi:predicted CoA-binding protein
VDQVVSSGIFQSVSLLNEVDMIAILQRQEEILPSLQNALRPWAGREWCNKETNQQNKKQTKQL